MNDKPIYNSHDVSPVCAQCGANYLKKWLFSNRCLACKRRLIIWVVIGAAIGIVMGWLISRNLPQAGQVAIAAAAAAFAVGLVWWQWVKR